MTKQEEILLKQKTATDLVLIGYMMFLNDKELFKEASDYVNGFINCLSKEEMEKLLEKNKDLLEQALAHDVNQGS